MKQSYCGLATHPEANLTVNKCRMKTYGKNVYMKHNTEYEIEMFNPTQDIWMGIVKLDGKPIGGGGFVLNPGQRFWLERYPNEPRKLKFSTYDVNGKSQEVQRAIAKNGMVEIDFYREQELNNTITWTTGGFNYSGPNTTNWPLFKYDADYWTTCSDGTGSITGNSTVADICSTLTSTSTNAVYHSSMGESNCKGIITDATTDNTRKKCNTKSMETGRTEKGSHSEQRFVAVDNQFEISPRYSVAFKILPESQQRQEVQDIRTYCTNCGRRLKKGENFCASCGTKR